MTIGVGFVIAPTMIFWRAEHTLATHGVGDGHRDRWPSLRFRFRSGSQNKKIDIEEQTLSNCVTLATPTVALLYSGHTASPTPPAAQPQAIPFPMGPSKSGLRTKEIPNEEDGATCRFGRAVGSSGRLQPPTPPP